MGKIRSDDWTTWGWELGHRDIGRTRVVTTRHNASRWAQQPLPPTTTTKGPHNSTTTTMDKDPEYFTRNFARLRLLFQGCPLTEGALRG